MDNSNDRFKILNSSTGITPKKKYKRKIAAIMSADVKDYSKLMERNDEQTVSTITEYRQVFFDKVSEHSGIIIDSPGDNILSEFGSAVDAVKCAMEIQTSIKERNKKLKKNHMMKFRIGINLGDIIEDQGRLYGDGVNIAARLESLAKAGGICISGTVYDHVKYKMNLNVAYLGKQPVKNINRPVRTYKLIMHKSELIFKREYKSTLYFLGAILSLYLLYNFHIRFLLADSGIMPFLILNSIMLIKSYLFLSIPPVLIGIGFIVYLIIKKGIDSRLLKFLRAFCWGGIVSVLIIILSFQIPASQQFGFQTSIHSSSHFFVEVDANSVNVYGTQNLKLEPIKELSSGELLMLSDTMQSSLNPWNKVYFTENRIAWIYKFDAVGNQVISMRKYSINYSDLLSIIVGLIIGIISYRRKVL